MLDRELWERWLPRGAVAALTLCLPVVAAGQAELSAKGDTIHGRVADLTADGVTFDPASGKGSIEVPWADVQALQTEDDYVVLHGDEGEARGRILGVEDGKTLLVGESPANAERLDVSTLFHAYDQSKARGSWVERMRSRLRYWKTMLDVGGAYTNSTTDTVLGSAGLRIERKKAPTLLTFEAGTRYAKQHEPHEASTTTENVSFAFGRGEFDLTERFYSYASARFTHDEQLHLALRSEPRLGAGYYWIKGKKANFSSDVGVAWISETFFGDDGAFPFEHGRGHDEFWSIASGAQADAELPYGALWRARAEYLPAVDDWLHDYLARAETSIDMPLLEWLAFRVAFGDEYDNTPAPGAQHNKFTATAGLSIQFLP
jgi:Protein of unknown function, DUF481